MEQLRQQAVASGIIMQPRRHHLITVLTFLKTQKPEHIGEVKAGLKLNSRARCGVAKLPATPYLNLCGEKVEEHMGITGKSAAFYFTINIVIYILLTGFLLYSEKQTTYDRLSNQLYYDNILLVYNGKNIDWDNVEGSEQYKVYVEVNSNCRILIKDTSKWTPPMLSGYYPKEEMGSVAIVGKNAKEMAYLDAKSNQWINFIGQEFRVTGIVGAEYTTACDDLVILFGAQLKESDLDNIIYIVDVKTQMGAQKMVKSLISEYPEIQIQQGAIRGTARLTKSSYFYRLLIAELLFITVFSIFIIGKLRHKKYDMSYKVYQICGLPLIFILIKGELEILVKNIISLFITIGVGYIGGLLTRSQFKNVIWISMGITILSGMLEAMFFGQKIVKITACNQRLKKCGAKICNERA